MASAPMGSKYYRRQAINDKNLPDHLSPVIQLTAMTAKHLKDLLRRERTNLYRNLGVLRMLSVKEGLEEITIIAEIANPLPNKIAELSKYLESIFGKKVKVIAEANTEKVVTLGRRHTIIEPTDCLVAKNKR